MMKKFLALILSCCIVFSLTACSEKPCTHDYTSSIAKEATCAETGTQVLTCKLCGDSYNETIPKSENHNYSSSITENATCGEAGRKTFSCITCGDSYEEDITPTGMHSFEINITKNPTCKETGIETSTCRICSNSYNRDIPKTDDHDYESTVLKEATNSVAGLKKFTCTICDDTYEKSFKLSVVTCNSHQAGRLVTNNAGYSGFLYCQADSMTMNQNNEITHIQVLFTNNSPVSYFTDHKVFEFQVIKLNNGSIIGGTTVRSSTIKTPFYLPEGTTEYLNMELKTPLALSEDACYEIWVFIK